MSIHAAASPENIADSASKAKRELMDIVLIVIGWIIVSVLYVLAIQN